MICQWQMNVLIKLNLTEVSKNIIFDHLNDTCSEWMFFIKDCQIRKVKSYREKKVAEINSSLPANNAKASTNPNERLFLPAFE